jgi:hypothetical protein
MVNHPAVAIRVAASKRFLIGFRPAAFEIEIGKYVAAPMMIPPITQ